MAEREFKLTFLGDSRKAQAAIGDLDKKMGGLGGQLSKTTGLMIGPQGLAFAAGTAVVGGMLASAKATAAYADEIEEMSQRTGLSTDTLQELGHAAKLTGADIDGLEVGIRKMQSVLTDAANGSKSAEKALDQLGLSAKDLIGIGTDEQLRKITDALAAIEDPTTRASIAVDIFGRSGTAILPMLANGAEGMQQMRDEAHKLGTVMDEDAIRSAAEFQDKLDKLQAKLGALQRSLGGPLIGILSELADVFLNMADAMGKAAQAAEKVGDQLARLPGVGGKLQQADVQGSVVAAATSAIPVVGNANAIFQGVKNLGAKLGFDEGGVVPGPRGQAMLATVHGGETILPTHKGGGLGQTVNIYVNGVILGSEQELARLVVGLLHNNNQRGSLGLT